jgi:hypothetical protein
MDILTRTVDLYIMGSILMSAGKGRLLSIYGMR